MNQINREQFEAWLFSQPDERTFNYVEGYIDDKTGCVMCNYLREHTNLKFFIVGSRALTTKRGKNLLPTWFIDMMERRHNCLMTAKQTKDIYLLQFPNAIVGNNDVPAIAANSSFNSIAPAVESSRAQS